MARADDDARLAIPVALAERSVVVGAAVLDRRELAVAVVDADRDRARRGRASSPREEAPPPGQTSMSASSATVRGRRSRRGPAGSGVPFALCSATLSVVRPSIAHLRRIGVSGIPISSSSSSLSSTATSDAFLPCTISVSIDVAACEIAQPRPENFTSSIVSRVLAEADVDRHLVAAERVHPLGVGVGVLHHAVPARVLVVVEDHLAVELVELAHPSTFFTRSTPATSRSTSSANGVEVEARARRRRDAEPRHQRLRAVVAGADRDALPVEHLRDVVRVDPVDVERDDPGAALRRRAVARDAVDLAELLERVRERARARAPRSPRARPRSGSRRRRRSRPPRRSRASRPRTCRAARSRSSCRA